MRTRPNPTGELGAAMRETVAAMLESGMPSAGRLATASGLSLRTLQRRLAAEGTSFSALLEDVRREQALSAARRRRRLARQSLRQPRIQAPVSPDPRRAPLDRQAAEPRPPGRRH